jgi:AraC family transcriptional regulator
MDNKETDKKTVLRIKNMVCPRCIMVVYDKLQQAGLKVLHVELGYAEVANSSELNIQQVDRILKEVGFELIFDKDKVLIEEMKVLVLKYLNYLGTRQRVESFSAFLSMKLGRDYTYLSKLFSRMEGRTIQNFLILQKTERVKELLDYEELTLSQIAANLGYSSVHYLSSQFKKITGVSVSSYKRKKQFKRKSLDGV